MTRKIFIMNASDLTIGNVKHFNLGPQKGIVFNDEGVLKAYINACTHMGGPTVLEGAVLRCKWHQAEFDPTSGNRLCGQAPEGTCLPKIELIQEDEKIFALWSIHDPFA